MAKTVMVFGTFDRIHPGHLNFFQQARQYGDHLIVIIARDRTAQRVKGRRPLNSENDRRKMVAALNFVDRAVLGHPTDQMKVIHRLIGLRQPSRI
jgi:FAD synthetase